MVETVAIMQPTYFPWLGYLAMIDRVDKFVFLDDIQFSKRSWQQRNRIKSKKGEMWLTIPVLSKSKYTQNIKEVVCHELDKNINKHLATIRHCYRRSPEYDGFFPFLEEAMSHAYKESNNKLASFNMLLVQKLCDYSGIKYESVKSSHLDVTGNKDERLSKICVKLRSSTYLSPPGSKCYLDKSDHFKKNGISIIYHEYFEEKYKQLHGEKVSNLSCLDAFFSIPREDLRDFIMRGIR